MSPELEVAIRERIAAGHTKKQTTTELRTAGYDEVVIEQLYTTMQAGQTAPVTTVPISIAAKKTVSPFLVAIGPFIFLIGLLVVWGGINLLGYGASSDVFTYITNIVIPFLIGLCFLAIPICITWGIFLGYARYDGAIRCGNCNYNGVGESGRSVWAQILAWLALIVFWPITLIYFLATHRYRCPSCKSTFIGLRDKNGVYTTPSRRGGVVVIILILILVIVSVCILAAVVLASLNDARDSANRVVDQQTSVVNVPGLSPLISEAE
jgi:hypothetical protein